MCKLFVLALCFAAVAGQMTQAMRDRILYDHNMKRRQATNAANMIELRYDMVLEQTAQAYLSRGCGGGFQHNSNRGCDYKNRGGVNGGTGTCASVGENWYSGYTDNTTGVDVVIGGAVAQWTDGTCSSWASPPLRCGSRWCSEKQNFYQTGSDSYGRCTQTSGQVLHYTQAMWATTTHVGCGYTQACGTLCNYAPAGNMNLPSMGSMREANIWKIGTPCSACPSGFGRCNAGLCSFGTSTPTTCPADTTTKPANGVVGTCGSTTAVGSSCSVACNTGYRLTSGSLTRQCTSAGSLSAMTAVCTAISCPADSSKPVNGDVGTCNTERTYGQTCSQTCNSGYYVSSGSLVRTCGTSGQYGSSTASCSAITCAGSTTFPANGNAGTCATSKTYGQTCAQACNSGFTLSSGSLVRTCGANGQFSDSSAVCTATATQAPATQPPATQPPATTAPGTPSPTSAPGDYCSSGPTSDVDTEFGYFSINGYQSQIEDVEGCPGSTGPTINTGMSVTLVKGETYTLNILRTTCGDYFTALVGAWADWDQNKQWDSTETLFPFTRDYGMINQTFTVPTSARPGPTRMRIQVQETKPLTLNPCAMFEWGDTKDYSIVVVEATTTPATPAPTTPAPSVYCTSGPTSDLDSEFGYVSINGYQSQIADAEGCPGSTGPTLSDLSVTLLKGERYTLNILRTTCRDFYTALVGAWVDWDQDRQWEDTETLFPFTQEYGMMNKTFTVPTSAKSGYARMRIQVQETAALSIAPCTMFEWGDTKDYWVLVNQA